MGAMKLPEQVIHAWLEDGQRVRENYGELILKEGLISAKSLGERKEDRDLRFFDRLFDTISISSGDSILDVGCGKGELLDYFSLRFPNYKNYDYLGIDLVPEFIKLAKQNFPCREFEVANFIDPSFYPDKKFDVVLALGVLVTRVRDYNLFVECFLKKMVQCAKKYVLFNVISNIDPSSSNYSDPNGVGHSTVLNAEVLRSFVDTIPYSSYRAKPYNIFPDATDLFVQIQLQP